MRSGVALPHERVAPLHERVAPPHKERVAPPHERVAPPNEERVAPPHEERVAPPHERVANLADYSPFAYRGLHVRPLDQDVGSDVTKTSRYCRRTHRPKLFTKAVTDCAALARRITETSVRCTLLRQASMLLHHHDGNTARLARRRDEGLGVRIVPSLLGLEPAAATYTYSACIDWNEVKMEQWPGKREHPDKNTASIRQHPSRLPHARIRSTPLGEPTPVRRGGRRGAIRQRRQPKFDRPVQVSIKLHEISGKGGCWEGKGDGEGFLGSTTFSGITSAHHISSQHDRLSAVNRTACNEWSHYLTPALANWVRIPSFACENLAGRCRWSVGFLGVLPFSPPFHSGAYPYSPHFAPIGSQYSIRGSCTLFESNRSVSKDIWAALNIVVWRADEGD
ncbi:hypothetical protein PR048_025428 [Dryococelus australis]|uniref:Uncharacterized protein n=1 Tax=Dryococelus australis TaxID=614101 RepID=A0ABQ9GRA8_9NEOP|nr:hypothetical protein PR048_025428 [Dryococelus australis]